MSLMTSKLTRDFLKSFEASKIFEMTKMYVGDTSLFEVGSIIQLSERLTRIQKIKKFFRLYSSPTYKVIKKDAESLYILPSSLVSGHFISKWSLLPKILTDTVKFRRPEEYMRKRRAEEGKK